MLALGMREHTGTLEENDLTFLGLAGMAGSGTPGSGGGGRGICGGGGDDCDDHRRPHGYGVCDRKRTRDRHAALGVYLGRGTGGDGGSRQLARRMRKTRVFAHVSPEHKVRIVAACKKNGAITAMTGDGVNDAPSLKVADVGIAMGMAGTDVAKNAADIVLADDNFATITKAIAQGRCIYENIRKAVLFLLSSNFGEIITMLAGDLMGLASPLKSSHILWINLDHRLPSRACARRRRGGEQKLHGPTAAP